MTYRAPVDDIAFALRNAAGLGPALADGLYGDLSDDVIQAVLEQAGKFATDVLAPLNTIGDRYGPFDLAFVKIGAYGPGAPWLDIHMSAEDAVRAHVDVRARRLFPVHWGTFNLAFHGWDEPIRRAVAAAQRERVELLTPRIGETVDADRPFPFNPWWERVR